MFNAIFWPIIGSPLIFVSFPVKFLLDTTKAQLEGGLVEKPHQIGISILYSINVFLFIYFTTLKHASSWCFVYRGGFHHKLPNLPKTPQGLPFHFPSTKNIKSSSNSITNSPARTILTIPISEHIKNILDKAKYNYIM